MTKTAMRDLYIRSAMLLGVLAPIAVLNAAPSQPAEASSDTSPVQSSSDSAPAPSSALEEVLVTAQRRSESLQRVPLAVTAVSGNDLKNSGVSDASQLTNLVPGLSFQVAGAEFEPHLRGIGTTSDGPGLENPVALYVDGVYYGPQSSIPRELFNVDQVSVLKGPQGTLFGRNATGGVIQMTTRNPTQSFEGEIQTSLDNYLNTENDVYVSGGLASDLAANLWVHYGYQADGWGVNEATGTDIGRINKDVALRQKSVYTPTDTTKITVSLDYLNRIDSMGLCLQAYPGTKPLLPGAVQTGNPWNNDSSTDCTEWVKSGGAGVTLEQDLGFAKLVNISAYRQFAYQSTFSATLSPIPGESLIDPEDGKQVSEELQLVSPNSDRFSWTTGLYFFHANNASGPGADPGLQIYLAGPLAPTPTSLGEIDFHTNQVDNSVALFGQGTYEVLTDTHLTTGLRYTYEHKSFSGTEDGTLVNGFPLGALYVAEQPAITEGRATWRLALDHNFTTDVLGYVSYNRGFKSGGYNGNDPTNPPYGPETLDAYEIGIKSELFDNRLRVNGAGFYYKYDNIQVSKYTTTAVIYNGASAQIYGIDLDATARLTDHLTLTSGLEVLNSKFTRFPNGEFGQQLPGGGVSLSAGDATGNQLPFAPKATVDLALDYSTRTPIGQLNLNLTDYYNNGYYMESSNFLRQNAYDLLATSVKLTPAHGAFSIKLWANNLLNKAIYSFSAIQNTGFDIAYGNPPRTYGVTLNYQF